MELGTCGEARSGTGGKTGAQAWKSCQRGDWLFWLVIRVGLLEEVENAIIPLLNPGARWLRNRSGKYCADSSAQYFRIQCWSIWDRDRPSSNKPLLRKTAKIIKDNITWSEMKDAMRKSV